MVSPTDTAYFSETWPWLGEYILHYHLMARFLNEVQECYHKCCFHLGIDNMQETPLEFIICKLKYICALYPQPQVPDPGLELAEVQRALEDIPKQWYQHLNLAQILTMDELM